MFRLISGEDFAKVFYDRWCIDGNTIKITPVLPVEVVRLLAHGRDDGGPGDGIGGDQMEMVCAL